MKRGLFSGDNHHNEIQLISTDIDLFLGKFAEQANNKYYLIHKEWGYTSEQVNKMRSADVYELLLTANQKIKDRSKKK